MGVKINSATFRTNDGSEPNSLVKAAMDKSGIVEAKKDK